MSWTRIDSDYEAYPRKKADGWIVGVRTDRGTLSVLGSYPTREAAIEAARDFVRGQLHPERVASPADIVKVRRELAKGRK